MGELPNELGDLESTPSLSQEPFWAFTHEDRLGSLSGDPPAHTALTLCLYAAHPPLLSPTTSSHLSELHRGSSQADKAQQITSTSYYFSVLRSPYQ